MKFLPFVKDSISNGVRISFLLIAVGTISLAQDPYLDAGDEFAQVYGATVIALLPDPFIQNGIYYTYPYYNAIGHPFLDQKEFEKGSVVFRKKRYADLSINYDLFNQQLILSQETDGVLQMNLLDAEFVSGFQLKGKEFVKAASRGEAARYMQVISETRTVSCYYSWYKERREVRDSGNRSVYSFSDQRSRHYLLMNGQLVRYKNNKSFLKIFPEPSREQIKDYIQQNRVMVMEADDLEMKGLIEHCARILDQWTMGGGA